MAWLNQLQHDLQQIAINRDGVWHLTGDAGSQATILPTNRSAGEVRQSARL
jgi:hypothetical protein